MVRSLFTSGWTVLSLIGLLVALLPSAPQTAMAQSDSLPPLIHTEFSDDRTDGFDWLEPRGIHIIDLVGLAPEEHLRDTVFTFNYNGSNQYISGSRTGNTTTVEVRVIPRMATFENGPATMFSCPGQYGVYDQWPASLGPSTMRLYENGQEITHSVLTMLEFPARQDYPIRNTGGIRYPEISWYNVSFSASGELIVPAHMDCFFFMQGHHPDLIAKYTFPSNPSSISLEHLGGESFWFHSYIGVGEAGHVNSLRSQMQGRFGSRHDKFRLNPPAGADYVLVKYPPRPISPYAGYDWETNVSTPSSGTYRLAHGVSTLSNDHTVSMAMPLYVQWKDADISGGGAFRPRIGGIDTLTAPEYFVPPGFSYDPCMTYGGCPDSLLDAIHAKSAEIELFYYRVQRTAGGLDRIPLRAVGSGYQPADVAASPSGTTSAAHLPLAHRVAVVDSALAREMIAQSSPAPQESQSTTDSFVLYLPLLRSPEEVVVIPVEPDDPTGCPCGWFDPYGRMFDVIP